MNLKKTTLTLILLIVSFQAFGKLIKSGEIFISQQFNSFAISPNGQAFIGQSFLDGYHQLFAFKSDTTEAAEIFKISNSNQMRIVDYNWIDNDTAYVTYIGQLKMFYTRFIDFEFDENNDFDIDYFNVSGTGLIINPMPDREDKALYAKLDTDDRDFNLLEIDVSKLRNVKQSSKSHRKVFRTFRNLSDDLSNVYEFYVSNDTYQLEIIGQYFDDFDTYSIYNEQNDSWDEFFRLSKTRKEGENVSKLDVFQPIAKISPRKVVALSNISRDKVAVVIYDTKAKKDIEVLYESASYDVKSASYDTQQNRLRSVTYIDRGVNKQKFLDTANNETQQKLHDEIGLDSIFVVDSSLDKVNKVIFAYDASHPGKFYHYNEDTGHLRFLQNSMPDLYPYTFSKAKLITAKNEINKTVEGFLYLPNENEKHPLVVMPHGGPIGVQDRNEFDREIQFLVNRGFAVLTINFRGSSGYGKEYMNAGREQFGQGIESDINLLAQKVLKTPHINTDKVCIYGTSYGGYSAIASTILYPSVYKCAVSAFGVFDLPLLYSATNLHHAKSAKEAIAFIVGDLDSNYQKLKENSPLYKAEQISVPTLIFSGKNDEVAHPEHSRRLNLVLERIGNKSVEYHEYTRSGHGHSNWLGDRHQYLTIVEFLNKHIPPKLNITDRDKKVISQDHFTLGMVYYHGYFVEKDTKKAEHYLRLAHKNGHDSAAQYLRRLGVYDI